MNTKLALSVVALSACAAAVLVGHATLETMRSHRAFAQSTTIGSQPLSGTIGDYFGDNIFLHHTTLDIIAEMSAEDKAGMLLMPAWESNQTLDEFLAMIDRYHLGGAMVLRTDATPAQVQRVARVLEYQHSGGTLQGLLATDAEPSLMSMRFPLEGYTTNTNSLDTVAQSEQAAHDIADIITRYGYNVDFAPVYDSARNQTVIGNRAYGRDTADIVSLANAFARALEQEGVIPTAKHFPGHGYAVGDTHVSLQSIPGSLPEQQVFQSAIDGGIPMVMIGHLAIDGGVYDTLGLPSTISATSSTVLLRETTGFEGVVITDAMNMGALDDIADVDTRALEAGTDIVLMPRDISASHSAIVERIKTDASFEASVLERLYRIIRLRLVQQWAR